MFENFDISLELLLFTQQSDDAEQQTCENMKNLTKVVQTHIFRRVAVSEVKTRSIRVCRIAGQNGTNSLVF